MAGWLAGENEIKAISSSKSKLKMSLAIIFLYKLTMII